MGTTAVITGGASGIGLALARRALKDGMNVAVADVDAEALERARVTLDAPDRMLTVRTDVSDLAQVEALRDAALARFGRVDVLFNNAGVGAGGGLLATTPEDWAWVMDVNFGGALNGVRTFLPHLQARGSGHIVNTSSLAGILPFHPSAAYQVSKAAIVALTEHLFVTLLQSGSAVRASVLCPGNVATRIMDSGRLRPHDHPTAPPPAPVLEQLRASVAAGTEPDRIADATFEGMRRGELYIVTHADYLEHLERRTAMILASAKRNSEARAA